MKLFIATLSMTLAVTAPAFAEVTDAKKHFAQSNPSAAETVLWATSTGDPVGTAELLAMTNESPAENSVNFERARSVDVDAVQQMFALTNDSPAEAVLK